MIDDGSRLSFSISRNGYNIVDNLSGKTIINVRGNLTAFTLEKDIVLEHIQNLQEAILTYRESVPLFKQPIAISSGDTLTIREDAHYKWTVCFNGKGGTLSDGKFIHAINFDKDEFLRVLNKTYADLVLHNVQLNPKRNIVRRIIDAGLLVWVYDNHTVVTYESNVTGNCMINCLVDGKHFNVILVSTSKELGVTTLFTSALEEIISFPTDDSILTFYPADEDAFNV